MEFTSERKSLKNALESVNQACRKTTSENTSCVKLMLSGQTLELTGYDLETGITAVINAECGTESGEILLNCGKLLEIVSKQSGDEVNISIDTENMTAVIKSGRSSCKIPALSADAYPTVPGFEEKSSLSLSSELLSEMIRQTIFAAAAGGSKPIQTGECFTVKDGTFEIAALDGFRLAVRTEKTDSGYSGQFVVKADALRTVLKLSKASENVRVIRCPRHAVFDFGSVKLFSRLLEGDFHNYKAILPKESKTEAVISVRPAAEALERFSLLVNDKIKAPLRCKFHSGAIDMSLKSPVGEMQESIDGVDFSGNEVEIGFNCRFLLEALKAAESDKVRLLLGSAVTPMMILPAEGDAFTFLVLPVRLRAE